MNKRMCKTIEDATLDKPSLTEEEITHCIKTAKKYTSPTTDCDACRERIRDKAIDELSDLIDRLLWEYDLETYKDLSEGFKESAKLLKEQANE